MKLQTNLLRWLAKLKKILVKTHMQENKNLPSEIISSHYHSFTLSFFQKRPSLARHERGGCAGPLRCGKGTTWEGKEVSIQQCLAFSFSHLAS